MRFAGNLISGEAKLRHPPFIVFSGDRSTYDRTGQLLSVAGNATANQFSYDALGRTRFGATINDVAAVQPNSVLRNTYDVAGRMTGMNQQIGTTKDFANTYGYDDRDRLISVSQAGQTGGNTVAGKKVGVSYDAAGRVDQIKRYNNAAGSGTATVTSTYTFDDAYRLTGLVHANSASTSINTYAWSWDASNRLTTASSKVNGSSTAQWSVAYGYDDRGQLTTADWTTVSGLSSLLVDESYNYTDNGNRSGSQTNGVGTKTYVNSTNNQTTADGRSTYTYDSEGNRATKTDNVSGAFTLYSWDNRDRLVKVTEKISSTGSTTKIFEEVYDAFDRWIGEKIDANGDGDYLDTNDHAARSSTTA